MAAPRRRSFISAWTDRILRRPPDIKPFRLEDGAQMRGDPTTPEGARIEGGSLHIDPGYVAEVQDGGSKMVFRMGTGQGVAGAVYCQCSAPEKGECALLVEGDHVKCGGDPCCKISFVVRDPGLSSSGITRSG